MNEKRTNEGQINLNNYEIRQDGLYDLINEVYIEDIKFKKAYYQKRKALDSYFGKTLKEEELRDEEEKFYTVKNGCHFVKFIIEPNKENNLSWQACGIIHKLIPYCEYGTNILLYNKQPVKNKNIIDICKIDKKLLSRILKELEEKQIIFIKGTTKNREIILNPEYFRFGNRIKIK